MKTTLCFTLILLSFTGLEHAINLQVLELSDQGIQDITPLAKLSILQV